MIRCFRLAGKYLINAEKFKLVFVVFVWPVHGPKYPVNLAIANRGAREDTGIKTKWPDLDSAHFDRCVLSLRVSDTEIRSTSTELRKILFPSKFGKKWSGSDLGQIA